jgi:ParB-like chromosome segregation protein Spo0J
MTTTDTSSPKITGKCHPACLLLPEMTPEEFRDLAEDLRNHGQRHPIIVDAEGVILDGRHRYRAVKEELFLEPKAQTFYGDEREKAALVMSENVHRRHLTTQQRAAIAAELATMRSGTRTDLASHGATSEMSDADAAKVMHVSERSVERAKARMRTDPDAHAKAKAGTLKRKQPQSAPQRMRRQWDAMQKAKPQPVEARTTNWLKTSGGSNTANRSARPGMARSCPLSVKPKTSSCRWLRWPMPPRTVTSMR